MDARKELPPSMFGSHVTQACKFNGTLISATFDRYDSGNWPIRQITVAKCQIRQIRVAKCRIRQISVAKCRIRQIRVAKFRIRQIRFIAELKNWMIYNGT